MPAPQTACSILLTKAPSLLEVVARLPCDASSGTWYLYRCASCGSLRPGQPELLQSVDTHHCGASCRFWSKVLCSSPDACWVWTGAVNEFGYGKFCVDGKVIRAHRYIWAQYYATTLTPGELLLHSCDTRRCVNWRHLRVGDHAQNMRDMAMKGRAKGGKVYLLPYAKKRMQEDFRQGGLSHSDLADRYGVSLATVRRTLREASSGGR